MKRIAIILALFFGAAQASPNNSMLVFFAIEATINPTIPVHLCCSNAELDRGHDRRTEQGKHFAVGADRIVKPGEVCHVLQVDPVGSSFKATYDSSCTAAQIAAGNEAIVSFQSAAPTK